MNADGKKSDMRVQGSQKKFLESLPEDIGNCSVCSAAR